MKASPVRAALLLCAFTAASFAGTSTVTAQELNMHFSCGEARNDQGLKSFFADNGWIRLNGSKIEEFTWESSVFRTNLGLECSMDQSDGLQAEFIGDEQRLSWRVILQDAAAARDKRGYDFSHGLNCSVRFERSGDSVHVTPECPALCGSRANFTEFSFDLKSGKCRYDD